MRNILFFRNKLVLLHMRSGQLTVECSVDTMSENQISHSGIIDSISNGVVHVRIVQSSACSSCKVASYCNSAEHKEKIIDVRCANTQKYEVGQNVMVMAAPSVGTKAVVLAFIIPIVILLTAIAVCLNLGTSEGIAALVGVAAMIPYYFILYLNREQLERVLTFYIK